MIPMTPELLMVALDLSQLLKNECITCRHAGKSPKAAKHCGPLLQNRHHQRRRQRPRLLLPCLAEGLDLGTAALLRGDCEGDVVRVEDGVLHGHAMHTNTVVKSAFEATIGH